MVLYATIHAAHVTPQNGSLGRGKMSEGEKTRRKKREKRVSRQWTLWRVWIVDPPKKSGACQEFVFEKKIFFLKCFIFSKTFWGKTGV